MKFLRRAPMPTIVPFLWEAIDRCDPTRSHEIKPSQRARHAHQINRSIFCLAIAAIGVTGLALAVAALV